MDKEIKSKWVAALRSGNYRQGKQYLHVENNNGEHTYCCLGVLCEVMEIPSKRNPMSGVYGYEDRPLKEPGTWQFAARSGLPVQVSISQNIESLGNLDVDGIEGLAFQNDKGVSFLEIADIIEKYIPED